MTLERMISKTSSLYCKDVQFLSKNYRTTERECIAIIESIKILRHRNAPDRRYIRDVSLVKVDRLLEVGA